MQSVSGRSSWSAAAGCRCGDWTISIKCSGRRPLLPQRALKGRRNLAPGSVPANPSPLPPNRRLGAIWGERFGERGSAVSCTARYSRKILGTKREFRRVSEVRRDLPPHPVPLPQHKKRVGGEGANCGNLDPGRRQRLLPQAHPGLKSDAPLGLCKEEAACLLPLPMSNLQGGSLLPST